MDFSSFTRDEKRFVLAEIIKSSTVDIDNLLAFIVANHVNPDWMSMQLPLVEGRNMNQCMKVIESMGGPTSSPKRPSTSSQGELGSRGTNSSVAGDTTGSSAQHLSPPMVNVPVAILPRPANRPDHGPVATPPTPPSATRPKKRGRPSRADKAKRDLRPNLPPRIAPRIQLATGHRPILPAEPHPASNTMQQTAQVYPTLEARQTKKRRVMSPVGRNQQASPSTFSTSSAISSPAM
ncbi:hypothetical protein VFPPC_13619 [Pochonia chlamydosporia 170]|uniref:Uncharacterized protein n=1 Tax=Pochonia chlamydosporia 170 TaxID=1380566 RepID=A0A179FSV5_METCM|nr:hypothetical protein VFPPC_13619 [Pochonia chlamydosporia 170]OAQ68099.1 hypothetical protein VFPPC_13619 [Pochonia chlamydosporia 170]